MERGGSVGFQPEALAAIAEVGAGAFAGDPRIVAGAVAGAEGGDIRHDERTAPGIEHRQRAGGEIKADTLDEARFIEPDGQRADIEQSDEFKVIAIAPARLRRGRIRRMVHDLRNDERGRRGRLRANAEAGLGEGTPFAVRGVADAGLHRRGGAGQRDGRGPCQRGWIHRAGAEPRVAAVERVVDDAVGRVLHRGGPVGRIERGIRVRLGVGNGERVGRRDIAAVLAEFRRMRCQPGALAVGGRPDIGFGELVTEFRGVIHGRGDGVVENGRAEEDVALVSVRRVDPVGEPRQGEGAGGQDVAEERLILRDDLVFEGRHAGIAHGPAIAEVPVDAVGELQPEAGVLAEAFVSAADFAAR